jgi:hypothetical protein
MLPTVTQRAERLSRELEDNMVDCKGDICSALYTELVSELPQFEIVGVHCSFLGTEPRKSSTYC